MPDLILSPIHEDQPLDESLAVQVQKYTQASRAESTIRAYKQDLEHFTQWCNQHARRAFPASPETVAAYISDLANQQRAVSTITRRLAAISQAHQLAKVASPTQNEQVRSTLKGIKRTRGSAPVVKAPATIEILRALLEHVGNGILGTRDRALLLLGFAGAFRRAELVGLNVPDIQFVPSGMVVVLRKSKTDQEGQGAKKAIPYGRNAETCPVRAIQDWLDWAGLEAGPIFRPIDRHGNIKPQPLSAQSVALIIKRYASAAGFAEEDFAGHSLRAGFATSAAATGAGERKIMQQTGHRSTEMVRRYIRDGELFRDNPLDLIGL